MAKTDWTLNDEVKPEDMNQIGQEINANADAAQQAQQTADDAMQMAESHAKRHAIGGADPLTPAQIGAETPSGAQAKANTAEQNAKDYADKINTLPANAFDISAPGTEYPIGITQFATTGSTHDWPETTGLVETNKPETYRVIQKFYSYTGARDLIRKWNHNSGEWSGWYDDWNSDTLPNPARQDGNYANLRARATTKADVGLSNLINDRQATKTEFDAHVNDNGAHGATSSATANRIIRRDGSGRASIATPTANGHIANKGYVDTETAHAEANAIAHTNDALKGFTFYKNLSEIGLSEGSETIESIVNALPNYSMLVFMKTTGNASSAYPENAGLLQVTKRSLGRIELTFNSINYTWAGYYDDNVTPSFRGWKRVWEDSNLPDPARVGTNNNFTQNQFIQGGGSYRVWAVARTIGSEEVRASLAVSAGGNAEITKTVDGTIIERLGIAGPGEAILGNDLMWTSGNNALSTSGGNGYQKLASGLLLQWGAVQDVPQGELTHVTFPIAFSGAPMSILANLDASGAAAVSVGSGTSTGFTVIHDFNISRQVLWMAIGRG